MARPRLHLRSTGDRSVDVRGERQAAPPYFTGDLFIQTYLHPLHEVGCAAHLKPDCLCDVDVTKTAGMTWDQVPAQLCGVDTAAELVEVAANIWLNEDVLARPAEVTGTLIDHPNMPAMLDAIKAGCTLEEARELVTVAAGTYLMLRKLFGLAPTRKTVPTARVIELAKQNISGTTAQQIIFEETGVLHSLSALRKAKIRAGYTARSADKGGRRTAYPWQLIWQLHEAGCSVDEIIVILQKREMPHRRQNVLRVIRRQRDKLSTNDAT